MPPQPTTAAPGSGTSSADAVAAAIAQAKKEKRAAAAAAAMAPRMQTQVQKWAKMTAELGGQPRGAADVDVDDAEDGNDARPRKRTKTGNALQKKQQKLDKDNLPYAKQLRAPHRRDRYVSFGVGRGLGKAAGKASVNTQSAPPTCLLCLARFDSRQQLRDHESLSAQHKRRLRDGAARKAAFQRFARVEAEPAEGTEAGELQDNEEKEKTEIRPPVHIKRIPRRRGDLAPTYTSYASIQKDDDHACLLCRRRFKSLATLRLHERESALHRARTRVPELVAAAVVAVQAAGGEDDEKARPLLKMRPSQANTNQYRDRARERRQAFGNNQAKANENKKEVKTESVNKGAALLSKMGWTAGQGLGAQGGGLTEAIAPSAYRVGVGLGAQGGNMGDAAEVAARRTEADGGGRTGSSYADFVEQAQEAARQRYKELDRAEAEAAAAAAAELAAAEAAAAELAAKEAAEADIAETGEKMEED